jgi:hypothetical protein
MVARNIQTESGYVKQDFSATSATPRDVDELAERFVIALKRAADAAHWLYRANPSGPTGQYVSRLKFQLCKMQEDAQEKLL